jgi:hypothetical protein
MLTCRIVTKYFPLFLPSIKFDISAAFLYQKERNSQKEKVGGGAVRSSTYNRGKGQANSGSESSQVMTLINLLANVTAGWWRGRALGEGGGVSDGTVTVALCSRGKKLSIWAVF